MESTLVFRLSYVPVETTAELALNLNIHGTNNVLVTRFVVNGKRLVQNVDSYAGFLKE